MSNSALNLITTTRLAAAAGDGSIVQLVAAGTVALATTAMLGVVQNNGSAAAAGSRVNIATSGQADVLCVAGLSATLLPGAPLYLSGTAGSATTDPASGVLVGTVVNAGAYTARSIVLASVQEAGVQRAGQATWPLNIVRYYAVDAVNGNDANVGYIDAAPNTIFVSTALEAVAKKTWLGLSGAIPGNGLGRSMCILVRGYSALTTYNNPAGTIDVQTLAGITGYKSIWVRASDFTNNANDKVDFACYTIFNGPNGDNSFTVQSYDAALLRVTIAAGALTTGTTLAGKKVQWAGNVTTLLRTQGWQIQRIISATVFEVTNVSPSIVPVAGDTFTIRAPSIEFDGYIGDGSQTLIGLSAAGNFVRTVLIAGFRYRSVGNIVTNQQPTNLNTLEFAASISLLLGKAFALSYADEGAVTIASRVGITCEANLTCAVKGDGVIVAIVKGLLITTPEKIQYQFLGAFFGAAIIAGGSILPPVVAGIAAASSAQQIGPGTSVTSFPKVYFGSTLILRQYMGQLDGVEINNAASPGAIQLQGTCIVMLKNIIGSTGNVGYGVDATLAVGSTIRFGSGNTVTGTLGDVKPVGVAVKTWAEVVAEGFADTNGNILVAEANGGPLKKLTAGSLANTPILGADPAGVIDGDVWATNIAGVRSMCVRMGGTTYRTTLT